MKGEGDDKKKGDSQKKSTFDFMSINRDFAFGVGMHLATQAL